MQTGFDRRPAVSYDTPMKIMHIGKYYSPFRGGMETVLQNIAEGLLERSREVTVLVAGDDSLERVEVLGDPKTGRTGRLVRAAVYGHYNSQPLTLDLLAALRREVARQDPDLIHLHLPNPLAAAVFLALASCGSMRLPPLELKLRFWLSPMVSPPAMPLA